MNTVVILLGTENAGKSGTIKEFFGWAKKRSIDFKIMNLNGKCTPVFVVYHGSPQELDNARTVSGVWNRIKKRLDYCKRETKDLLGLNNFVLLLPFTIQYRHGGIDKDRILEPIKKLKQDYAVSIVYLKGGGSDYNTEAEDFVNRKITPDKTIISQMGHEVEQAQKLEQFIKNLTV